MKKFFFIVSICVFAKLVSAQIFLKNPDFDGDVCPHTGGVCIVPEWNICENWVGVIDSATNSPGYPNTPYFGETFLLFFPIFAPPGYPNIPSFITQKLPCSLKKNKTYRFQIAASSYLYPFQDLDTAFFLIKGANDSCGVNATEEMYRSAYLEYNWRKLNIAITPKQDDYNYFMIYTYVDTTRSLRTSFPRLLLDDLSPIYPHNGNAVHIQNIADTTIQPGACVQLQATADITTYDTVFWLKKYPVQDGFRTDTIRNTFTLNDCPISSTTYIIALRDSVPDCAGYWWSYDTVKVTVNTGTGVAPLSHAEGLGLRLFPNPATNTLTIKTSQLSPLTPQLIFAIQNPLGQTLQSGSINDTQMTIDISLLPKGVYIFTLLKNNKILQYEKLVKQ